MHNNDDDEENVAFLTDTSLSKLSKPTGSSGSYNTTADSKSLFAVLFTFFVGIAVIVLVWNQGKNIVLSRRIVEIGNLDAKSESRKRVIGHRIFRSCERFSRLIRSPPRNQSSLEASAKNDHTLHHHSPLAPASASDFEVPSYIQHKTPEQSRFYSVLVLDVECLRVEVLLRVYVNDNQVPQLVPKPLHPPPIGTWPIAAFVTRIALFLQLL
jgi:hypothetical protein